MLKLRKFKNVVCGTILYLALCIPNASFALPNTTVRPTMETVTTPRVSSQRGTERRIFDKVVGRATAIAADRFFTHTVVAVGDEGRVYRWNEEPWDWEEIGGPSNTVQVFVGFHTILRWSEDGVLEEYKQGKGWKYRGHFEHGSVEQPTIIEVNPAGTIYLLPEGRKGVMKWNPDSKTWDIIGAAARQIVGSITGVYAVAWDKQEVWHYDEKTEKWGLEFDYPGWPSSAHDFNEDVDITVIRAEPPEDASEDEWRRSESLWIKYFSNRPPADYTIARWDRLTQTMAFPLFYNRFANRRCEDQRGAEHMVCFSDRSLLRPTDDPNLNPLFEYFGFLEKNSTDWIKDYADNGEKPLILGGSGNIYMESTRQSD